MPDRRSGEHIDEIGSVPDVRLDFRLHMRAARSIHH